MHKLAPTRTLRYDSVMSSRTYFKGKRIAVIGLGPHGEMITDITFLIKAGALVAVYDLRSEARLKGYITLLRSAGLISYVCGSIPPEDLLDMDAIILSHEYPRDSSFLAPAQEKKIPIEYPETMFFRLAPAVTVVGIIGVAGKSTVMSMLTPMLQSVCGARAEQRLFIIDPESEEGTLVHLAKVKSNDVVLILIEQAMLTELYALRMSPYIAVLTSVPSMGYMKSPFEILSYQTYNNFIIGSDKVIDAIHADRFHARAKMFRTKASAVPAGWEFRGTGKHDRENAALALEAAYVLNVTVDTARDVLEKWKPLKGRLEFVRKVKHVEFYNDTASTFSCSTEIGVSALAGEKNMILVFGGGESGCDYRTLYKLFPESVRTIILLPGSGTMKERKTLMAIPDMKMYSVPTIEEAVLLASEQAVKGDRVLFSPGFLAGGADRSRKERGDRFVKAVKSL